MRFTLATLLAAAALALLPGGARGQKFEAASEGAVALTAAGDVAALFWTATVDCAKAGDDLARRQCEGVKASRGEAAAGKLYTVPGEVSGITVGEWDAQKGGLPIVVRGCIACEKSVDIGGVPRYVITRGEVKIDGGVLRGPEIFKGVRKFPDEQAAKKWREKVLPRLKLDLVFKIPARVNAWAEGGAKGFAVDLVAFRVYDPCDGSIMACDPTSGPVKPDRAACGEPEPLEPDQQPDKQPDKQPEPKGPELPETLSSHAINKAMQKTRTEVNACFATYGVPGKADLTIEIGNDGKVRKVELRGEFEDTPTGECIVEAVKNTEFPPFKKSSMTINYPFILR